ncbi:hypothetical protein D3C75_617380 [compost metagenome]
MVVTGGYPAHQITDQEARYDGTDKAGAGVGAVEAAVVGDPAADKARRQGGAITDGVGDVARQYGDHQGEGGDAHVEDLVPHAPCRDLHAARGRVTADGERQRNQQAPGDDKGDHMGDAVHQVTVEVGTAARALLLALALILVRHIGGGLERLLDEALAILDGGLHAGLDERLAVEAGHVHLLVAGHDYGAGAGDLGRRRAVLDADGAVGLHLHLVTQLLGGALQGLCRQIGVGDAGRAAGDAYDEALVGGRGGHLRFFLLEQQGQRLGWALGCQQGIDKALFNQLGGELGQHLDMVVGATGRGGNHEE